MFKALYFIGIGIVGTMTFNYVMHNNEVVAFINGHPLESISSAVAATNPNNDPVVESVKGEIVAVSDGDTATLKTSSFGNVTIRLFAIDAPEAKCHGFSDNVCVEDGQASAKESKLYLRKLILKKPVVVRLGQGMSGKRLVGTILADGKDINLEMVKAGYAWHYKYFSKNQTPEDRKAYADAHNNAKWLRIGLWDDSNPIPPWDYRQQQKN